MQTDGLLHSGPSSRLSANVAQLVERLICNQLVVGSTPSVGSWMVRFDSVLTFGGGDVTTCLPTMCLLLFFSGRSVVGENDNAGGSSDGSETTTIRTGRLDLND